jgi:predicted nucleic acid-binding protein
MKLYLDTNILRDYLENRNPKSIELIEKARQENWECITSAFAMMELSDLQKDTLFFRKTVVGNKWDVDRFLRERRNKELMEEDFKDVENYLNLTSTKLPFIKFVNLAEEGWSIALYMASHSTLSAVDSTHLATAYTAGSEKVITNDTQFIKCGNKILETAKRKDISIYQPEKFLNELTKAKKS